MVHVDCIEEACSSITGNHLRYSNRKLLAYVMNYDLDALRISFCKGCYDDLCATIVHNYKALGRYNDGARFLEDSGRFDEACRMLAEIKSS